MRIRIGTSDHNYNRYGHGRSQMSEFERILHLFVSLQILFGSRRGGIWIPVVILVVVFGGIFVYNQMYNNPEKLLAAANQKWNTGVETQQMDAIIQYMEILNRKDSNILDSILNPSDGGAAAEKGPLLKDEEQRQILYKRVIQHKFKYVNEDDAALWVEMALNEGFQLEFFEEDVAKFWDKVTSKLGRSRPKSNATPKDQDGRFKNLPGVDDGASKFLPLGALAI